MSEDKLAIKFKDRQLARLLVRAGLTTPRAVRNATDDELRAINGVGPATLQAIRRKMPHDAERRNASQDKGG